MKIPDGAIPFFGVKRKCSSPINKQASLAGKHFQLT